MTRTTIVANLERSADVFGDRPALVQGNVRVSYNDLWRRANAVATWLEANGLEQGDRVALALENSIEYVVAYYGAMLAGAVVVALNASAKSRDFLIWLRHSGAAWLFCQSTKEIWVALDQLERRPGVIVVGQHDAMWPEGAASLDDVAATFGTRRLTRQPEDNDPASILYTSGTTGHPKGVVLSHANLASNTASIIDYLTLSHKDSIVSLLPFYYSYGNSVLHTHLAVGGCVVLENSFVFPHLVVEQLATLRCTGFAGVLSTFALLLARVALDVYDLSALRYVTQAGGPMSPSFTRQLRASLPGCQLYVMYGQTEATARLTYLPPEHLDHKLGSVGVPIRDVEIEVRREDSRVADRCEVGEVWAHGPNIMLGYWRDPDGTAETLRAGWLKTGDLGYLDEDGYLFLSGRRSDMIKTGAYRVHPREVEDVLAECDGVGEVAVVGVDDEMLGQAIKAFIVPAPGVTLDLMRIKAHVRAQLANYKVPKHLELVEALPKTASGKVRRTELAQRKQS